MGEPWLRKIFSQVDKDSSGYINETELQQVLSNGTWEPFNINSIRLMIKLFDTQRKGTINFDEFCRLWKFIDDWVKCYQAADVDRSGSITRDELLRCLTNFGYRFTDRFYSLVMAKLGVNNTITFDNFIYLCLNLQNFTNAFRVRDTQQLGTININYDDFVTMLLDIIP